MSSMAMALPEIGPVNTQAGNRNVHTIIRAVACECGSGCGSLWRRAYFSVSTTFLQV